MGFLEELRESTNKMIEEMESDSDYSRSQEFLEKFWEKRDELQDALDSSFGDEKNSINELLNLLNRKGKENDMESW